MWWKGILLKRAVVNIFFPKYVCPLLQIKDGNFGAFAFFEWGNFAVVNSQCSLMHHGTNLRTLHPCCDADANM